MPKSLLCCAVESAPMDMPPSTRTDTWLHESFQFQITLFVTLVELLCVYIWIHLD